MRAALLLLTLASACASEPVRYPEWTHASKGKQEYRNDGAACRFAAGPGWGEFSVVGLYARSKYTECMEERGWIWR